MLPKAKPWGTLRSRGNERHFPAELAMKCFVIPPDSKIENKTEKNCLLAINWHKFAAVYLIPCESKVQVVVSLES